MISRISDISYSILLNNGYQRIKEQRSILGNSTGFRNDFYNYSSIVCSTILDDPYAETYVKEDRKKGADVNIQNIKCVNSNENVNGVDTNKVQPEPPGVANAQVTEENGAGNGNGLLSEGIYFDKNLVNICVNVNVNEQIEEDQTDPCLLCIEERLTTEQITRINQILINGEFTLGMTLEPVNSLEELCQMLNERGQVPFGLISNFLQNVNAAIQPEGDQIPFDTLREVIQCLIDARLVMPPSS